MHFNRLESRARLTGSPQDHQAAVQEKSLEIAAYARADMVVTVSDDDRRLIERSLPNITVAVIPNVHSVYPHPEKQTRNFDEMLFVGGFKHEPNVDALIYFCNEILPLIVEKEPSAKLIVVGSNPTPAIQALASRHVEVLGYVPDTTPFLLRASISVAPLRYGGGMKGKVGEAMAHRLPVATTSFGAEGFGLEPGEHLLVGDTPARFAHNVLLLMQNPELRDRIARAGYNFIDLHYSPATIEQQLNSAIDQALCLAKKKQPIAASIHQKLTEFWNRNFAWRLNR